ncbi:MAG TPA: thioredoxin domain-containing protein [Patescibacteria group bacterium]|nr:thioredoxin domain-containing protein [Patescibacteria group bacterium]
MTYYDSKSKNYGEKKSNRLINEKSPYLLQHAFNPVDWYPWGEDAFEKAKREDKAIFLSVGYSTCHWCHVMEKESFEDEEVAQILNRDFVAIKVDREERPDVDHIYMTVCQAVTGQGGWPLTVVMTPEKKPFFVGTYIPKYPKWGRTGLLDLLAMLKEQWETNRQGVYAIGDKVVGVLQQTSEKRTTAANVDSGELNEEVLDAAFEQLLHDFDLNYGGFGAAPKFPTPQNFLFLLRYWKRSGDKKALAMVVKTLDAMRRGGIYDHLGYGFARYSTDEKWLAPHFEKMLYDNALLAYAYLEAYQCTGDPDMARLAEEILAYVLRDMTDAGGGFYSAEDADSEGVEGKCYLWTRQQIIEVLGPEKGSRFADLYDVTTDGNFEGSNILNLIRQDVDEFAAAYGLDVAALESELQRGREILLEQRRTRIPPLKDDKVLTAWNGLMIAAMAKAYRVLGDAQYLTAAERAADFVWQRLRREDGRLLARYRDGEAAYPGYLDDYAFLLWGMVELYESGFVIQRLRQAKELAAAMGELFADPTGGYFLVGTDGEKLLLRPKELYDGALPSGNSVAALALLKLARITGQSEWEAAADGVFRYFANDVRKMPRGYVFFLLALDYRLSPPEQVVVAGDEAQTSALLRVAWTEFLPNATVLYHQGSPEYEILVPVLAGKSRVNGMPAAYVCRNFSCLPPIMDEKQLLEELNKG